ncbi:MAG: hypothetical protein AAFQ87_04545 [Bacteroidota bacterium]
MFSLIGLGLVFGLLYAIGRYFYYLAEDHGKSRWGFAILGIVSYYVGTILFSLLFLLAYDIFDLVSFNEADNTALNVLSIPFGIAFCIGFYHLLKRIWSKQEKFDPNIIDQIGEQ